MTAADEHKDVQHMIQYASGGKESFEGKRVAISGSGNVAQYAALKAMELGATIISLSDSKGCLIATDEKGITPDLVHYIADLKVKRKQLTELSESAEYKNKFKYIGDGARPWVHCGKVDVALPSATQNEISGEEAEKLVEAGCKFVAEGSNMGSTQEAIDVFEKARKEKKGDSIWYGPGKSIRLVWSRLGERTDFYQRQGSQCRRRCGLWSRNGTEQPASEVECRGG
jgi:glutamate dehydrogenase (NADP+)